MVPIFGSGKNRLSLYAWIVVICGCAIFCTVQIHTKQPFHSNLLALLPDDEQNPAAHELSLLLANRFQDRLIILLESPDGEKTFSRSLQLAKEFKAKLLAFDYITEDRSSEQVQQQLKSLYRPFSQQLLTEDRRNWLRQNSPQELAEQTYAQLISPVATPRPYAFSEDPFNLAGYWFNSLFQDASFDEYQGVLVVDDNRRENSRWLVISLKLLQSPFDKDLQADVSSIIADFSTAHPGVELLKSGMFFHAEAGTRQAHSEISSVGIGSLIGIVVLVLMIFRSAWPLLTVVCVLSCGCLFALTVSLLVFDQIHIITLVFGSTLLGVAVDYVMHFLVTSQRLKSGSRARQHLAYAMAVGALTSMGAYLMQLATPFPGLQQMAVFSAAGIVGSWLCVMVIAPFYPTGRRASERVNTAAIIWFRGAQSFYRIFWCNPILIAGLIVGITVLAMSSVLLGGADDSVNNLNTSPKNLLASEQRVQEIMRQPSVSRFFYVNSHSQKQLRARLQVLDSKLKELNEKGLQWQSLQRFIPSQEQQRADRELVHSKLYGNQAAYSLLCKMLDIECPFLPETTSEFINTQALSGGVLGRLLPPFNQSADGWHTLVTLTGDGSNTTLQALADAMAGVTLVDQTESLSKLLKRYRLSIATLLGVTLLILACVLILRYRQRCWRMLLPLVVSMLLALGFAASEGITLFHLVALLLVLGIGIDTSVFYQEVGFNSDSWLASSLASVTSILAFGLLSLSAVPVLNQFGVIVLSGIVCCWLLHPLFHPPSTNFSIEHRKPGVIKE